MNRDKSVLTFVSLTASTLALIVVLGNLIFAEPEKNTSNTDKNIIQLTENITKLEAAIKADKSELVSANEKIKLLEAKATEYDALLGSIMEEEKEPAKTPVKTPAKAVDTGLKVDEKDPTKFVVTVPSLNFRETPTLSAKVQRLLVFNEKLTFKDQTKEANGYTWGKVTDKNGKEGWVAIDFTKKN